MTDKIIRGSGGSPPTPPSPTRAPDTLNSRQFASIQDLLSEGEIEGFATPSKAGLTKGTTAYNNAALKDIFLNDTPILQSSANNAAPEASKFNFNNVGFAFREGTGNQTHIPGIQPSASPIGAGFPKLCTKSGSPGPVSQALNTNIDAVEVIVTFDQIQKVTETNDILGSTVELKISLIIDGGTAVEKIRDTITGRSADSYSKQYRVNLPSTYNSATVKIERETDDRTSTDNIVDAFNVSLIQELTDTKQTYNNSAYTHLRLDSEQFSSIPKRSFRIRGVKVRIPAANGGITPTVVKNQTDATNLGLGTVSSFGFIHYPDGYVFNGQMGAAQWCSDPAMILLDLLTSQRYGFGTFLDADNSFTSTGISSTLDLYSFIEASRYASELVNDGFGTKEARFGCNVNIQGSMEAYQLINELAGVMRCFPIWSEGSVTITQDKPADPTYLFSLANVGEGGFSYSGSSLKQRHSIISVSYFNMDSQEIDYEVVGDNVTQPDFLQEDVDRQAKLGIIKKDIKAFACTSRGQARRLGKAVLLSEESESEVVTFTTSIESGAIVRPGNVIAINDPVKHGQRRSGRISAATRTVITVDNIQDLSEFGGSNQKVSVLMPNGTVEQKPCTVSIQNGQITLTTANQLSEAPNANAVWLLQSDESGETAQTFRVLSIEEQDGINYSISALIYRNEKYAAIDSMGGITLPPRSVSVLNEPKDPPSGLDAREIIAVVNALAVSKLILSWTSITGVSQYLVQYRFNNTNWITETVFRPDFEIFNNAAGTYEFKVYSFNAGLKLSTTSSNLTFIAVGKTKPPRPVENLTMEPVTNKLIRLRWSESIDPDVIHGGKVYVRHSNQTNGTGTFQNSVDLIQALAGNTTEAVVPSLEGEYILKFRDDQGFFSQDETSIIMDLPDLIDSQQITQDLQHTDGFLGAKSNLSVAGDGLELSDPAANLTGTYDFDNTIDLGAVFSLNLKRLVQTVGFAVGGQTITATYVRTTATISGQSQTVIEITSNSHGRSIGDYINFVAVAGGATDGVKPIVAVTTNTFQFLASESGAISSSACTFAFVNTIDQLIPAGTFWDDYAPNGNFDGPEVNDVTAALAVRTTNDNPGAGSPTYTDFNTFANGTFKGRGFQFRLSLASENIAHNISVQQLGITAEFESRTERSYVSGNSTSTAPLTSSSSVSGLDVDFGKPFFTGTSDLGGSTTAFLPSVGITIIGAAGGDYFVLSNITGTGFNIKILDSSNNPVNPAKQFTFQAVGYGKGV